MRPKFTWIVIFQFVSVVFSRKSLSLSDPSINFGALSPQSLLELKFNSSLPVPLKSQNRQHRRMRLDVASDVTQNPVRHHKLPSKVQSDLERHGSKKSSFRRANKTGVATTNSPVKFRKQSPFKIITDLALYAVDRNLVEPRTGLMIFGAVTAIQLIITATVMFGMTGAIVIGLMGMVLAFKLMFMGMVLMVG